MAQLYGQISMFDQLTDYNDNDNEEGNLEEQNCKSGRGEESEFDDNGEDGCVTDLHEYRQRMQVINEDI